MEESAIRKSHLIEYCHVNYGPHDVRSNIFSLLFLLLTWAAGIMTRSVLI